MRIKLTKADINKAFIRWARTGGLWWEQRSETSTGGREIMSTHKNNPYNKAELKDRERLIYETPSGERMVEQELMARSYGWEEGFMSAVAEDKAIEPVNTKKIEALKFASDIVMGDEGFMNPSAPFTKPTWEDVVKVILNIARQIEAYFKE